MCICNRDTYIAIVSRSIAQTTLAQAILSKRTCWKKTTLLETRYHLEWPSEPYKAAQVVPQTLQAQDCNTCMYMCMVRHIFTGALYRSHEIYYFQSVFPCLCKDIFLKTFRDLAIMRTGNMPKQLQFWCTTYPLTWEHNTSRLKAVLFMVQLASWTFQHMPVILWLVLAGCFQCDGGCISPFDTLMDQQFHMQKCKAHVCQI